MLYWGLFSSWSICSRTCEICLPAPQGETLRKGVRKDVRQEGALRVSEAEHAQAKLVADRWSPADNGADLVHTLGGIAVVSRRRHAEVGGLKGPA